MENEKINQLIEKIMDSEVTIDEVDSMVPRGGTRVKIDARTQPRDEPETPIRYEDWLKKQSKPKAIGVHKTKSKK
jgi:hypothetical protein